MTAQSHTADLREIVARIIDPEAMVTLEDLEADYRRENWRWSEAKVREVAKFAHGAGLKENARRPVVLAKADEILAAIAKATGEAGK